MLLVREKPGVVDFPDDLGGRRKAAGGVYFIGRILPGPQVGFKFIVRLQIPCEHEQDLVKARLAHFQIAVYGGICADSDEFAGFQLPDVVREGAVRDVQALGELVHAHFSFFQKQVQDGDPKLGAEGLEYLELLLKVLDVAHKKYPSLNTDAAGCDDSL